MGRNRGGGSSARSGGLFSKSAPSSSAAHPTAPKPSITTSQKAQPAPSYSTTQRATPATQTAGQSSLQSSSRQAPPPAQYQQSSSVPAQHAPPQSGGMMSGLGGMVVQGMAMGTGSAIAHQAVNSIASSFSGSKDSSSPPQPTLSSGNTTTGSQPTTLSSFDQQKSSGFGGVCGMNQLDLDKCMRENGNSASACQFYFDALRQCQDNANNSFA